MRELAAYFAGERHPYGATLAATGTKAGSGLPTLLLRDVATTGGLTIMDHCWIVATPALLAAGAKVGQRVRFSAIVRRYTRLDNTHDWGLDDLQDFCCKGRRR